ncbi:MAG TPA: ABC transporter permease [Sporosarcina sp.]|nr:ABC transporter permease [Sporosarcina sp.]
MEGFLNFFTYFFSNWSHLLELTIEHIIMVVTGLGLSLIVGIPLGVISAKNERLGKVIIAIASFIQVFPSIALLGILMIVLGLGFKTVVVGLFLYSLLPIIRNTYTGLKEVDPSITEAGRGVGMTAMQLLVKVQLPLAVPFLLAGVRVAAVIAIGVATLAPFVGGDGLGGDIMSGINSRNTNKIYSGAVVAALLSILADWSLGKTQQRLERKTS